MLKKNSPAWWGLIQASEVTLYCLAVGLFLWQGERIFQSMNYFLAPVLFLLLFSASVLICGLLVFFRPYKLFFEDKKREAAETVLATTAWLFFFMVVILLLVIAINTR